MKYKIRNFVIPFVLMFITNLGYYYLTNAPNFGGQLNPHLGILFIGGLFFGPLGAAGAALANLICDLIRGYSFPMSISSEIMSFLVSYFAYKLWYTKDESYSPVTKPRLSDIRNLLYLLGIILLCSTIYSVFQSNITEIFYPVESDLTRETLRYFVNFVNFSLVSSLIFMILSSYRDFSYTPKISNRKYNKTFRNVSLALIILVTTTIILFHFIFDVHADVHIFETIIIIILLLAYNSTPIKKINKITYVSIPEKIMITYIILSLIILMFDIIIYISPIFPEIMNLIYAIAVDQKHLLILEIMDVFIILITIPSLIMLGYLERKVIKPILSFSRIGSFIKDNEKIESEGLLDLYSDYTDDNDEIGILSRSYTRLIKNNNQYIENLRTLESEKQRNKAEMNIARSIQKSTLPKKSINDDKIKIEGYSKAARDVGGDFYDFYELDEENTMIIIGDASGKGVPAAIFTVIIQNSIKLLMKNELNPASVLYDVNNQICENNPEMMFITLFLGVYNKNNHKLTYANAGHNPPIIRTDRTYQLLDIDEEIVLGVLEDYEYKNYETTIEEEMILYTDGITDAQNVDQELYGIERFLNFLNNQKEDENLIKNLIKDISEFTGEEHQFDDMTLLTLTRKREK